MLPTARVPAQSSSQGVPFPITTPIPFTIITHMDIMSKTTTIVLATRQPTQARDEWHAHRYPQSDRVIIITVISRHILLILFPTLIIIISLLW